MIYIVVVHIIIHSDIYSDRVIVHIIMWYCTLYAHVHWFSLKGSGKSSKLFSTDVVETGIERLVVAISPQMPHPPK